MAKQEIQQKEVRLSIRANLDQKSALARAAKARHMNISQFVLQASLLEADQVINEATKIILTQTEFAWAFELMDKAPANNSRLRAALVEPPVWND